MKALLVAVCLFSSYAGAAKDAPKLSITRFGPAEPMVRVGQAATIVVEARNTGSAEAQSVAAAITLADRETHFTDTLLVKRVIKLAPGATARFEWEIEPKEAAEKIVVCRVNALGLEGEERSFSLSILPPLDPKPELAVNRPTPSGVLTEAPGLPMLWARGGEGILTVYPNLRTILDRGAGDPPSKSRMEHD